MLIRTLLRDALKDDGVTDQQIESVQALLQSNLVQATQKASRSYLSFVAFACAFTLITKTELPALTVLGISIDRRNPAVLTLPVIAAFQYYLAMATLLLQQLTHEALQAIYGERLKPFHSRDITTLFVYPTLVEMENAFDNMPFLGLKKLARVWLVTVCLLALVLPLCWFGIATRWILDLGTNGLWCAAVIFAVWLFAIRAVSAVIQSFRAV